MKAVSDFAGKYMAVIVLIVSVIALFIPDTCLWIQTGWINYLLMIVMFGMGLTMKAGDFAIVLYNPSSHKRKEYLRKACEILLENIEKDRPCGYVRNIGREGQTSGVMTLGELQDFEADMFTTVFIGNSGSRIIDGALVTGRGYKIEENIDFCWNN